MNGRTYHTPGPWLISDARPTLIYCAQDASPSTRGEPLIADVAANSAHITDPTERAANVQLIAAAPELLKVALGTCAALMLAGIREKADSNNPLESLLARALAAVGKAMGGTAPEAQQAEEQRA